MANEIGAFMSGPHLVLRPNTNGQILTESGVSFMGQQVLKNHAAYTGSGWFRDTAVVSTTDATVTPIYTISTASDYVYTISVLLAGKKASTVDGIGLRMLGCVTNNGGTLTETAAEQLGTPLENSAGTPTASLTIATTIITINVTGIAAENWAWCAGIEWVAVKTSA